MRKIAYVLAAVVFIFAVILKARHITEKEKKEVPRITAEWKEYGFPVDAEPVVRGPIAFITKVSGTLRGKNSIESDVPREIFQSLRVGQPFSSSKMGQSFSGFVQDVSGQGNPETGLFRVRLRIITPVDLPAYSIIVCFVETGVIGKTIKIPISAVQREDSREFCWVVQDNKAVKRYITLGRINTTHAQVQKGVSEGELVVVAGAQELTENALVRIHQAPGEQL